MWNTNYSVQQSQYSNQKTHQQSMSYQGPHSAFSYTDSPKRRNDAFEKPSSLIIPTYTADSNLQFMMASPFSGSGNATYNSFPQYNHNSALLTPISAPAQSLDLASPFSPVHEYDLTQFNFTDPMAFEMNLMSPTELNMMSPTELNMKMVSPTEMSMPRFPVHGSDDKPHSCNQCDVFRPNLEIFQTTTGSEATRRDPFQTVQAVFMHSLPNCIHKERRSQTAPQERQVL
jgi:hypothetical protein